MTEVAEKIRWRFQLLPWCLATSSCDLLASFKRQIILFCCAKHQNYLLALSQCNIFILKYFFCEIRVSSFVSVFLAFARTFTIWCAIVIFIFHIFHIWSFSWFCRLGLTKLDQHIGWRIQTNFFIWAVVNVHT